MATQEQLDAIKKIREQWTYEDDVRDHGLPETFEGIERINDLHYGEDPQWNILDVYRPKQYSGKLPVIILIHGGNWCYGTKETYQYYGMSLAQAGFAVINATYRLAPNVEFPDEMNDVDAYVNWTVDHASEYDFDLDNAFMSGDSAGAQMTLQYLTIWANPEYRQLFGYQDPRLTFRGGILNCGPYFMPRQNLWTATKAYYTDEIMKNKRDMVGTEDYYTSKIPPLYIATGNDDYLRDDSMRLAGFLIAKDHPFEAKVYGDKHHRQPHDFMINLRNSIGNQARMDEIEFMKSKVRKNHKMG